MGHYSMNATIPDGGLLRITEVGGSPYTDRGTRGFNEPSLIGTVEVRANGPGVRDIQFRVKGYSSTRVADGEMGCPVLTEFPCEVEITGPPATSVVIITQVSESTGASFGGKLSYQRAASDSSLIDIPAWASSVEIGSFPGSVPNDVEFLDALGNSVGHYAFQFILPRISIPNRAVYMRNNSAVNAITAVFRQR